MDHPFLRLRSVISRRQFIAGAAVVPMVGAAYGFSVEPSRITVTYHEIGPGSGGPRVRMVQISDLHLQKVSRHVRKVARIVNELSPEVILLTGDMIDRADRIGELESFLRLLDPRVEKYAVLGNWEHWARVDVAQLRAIYALHACRLLINESVVHAHSVGDILVTGMDDWTGGVPDLRTALSGVEPQDLHVVMAHSPVYRDMMVDEWDISGPTTRALAPPDIVLSGHTHGGQVALLGWAPVRPAGSGKYVAGWYRDTTVPMYVSRGIGTSVAPVRFGAPPEIAVFDWMPSTS